MYVPLFDPAAHLILYNNFTQVQFLLKKKKDIYIKLGVTQISEKFSFNFLSFHVFQSFLFATQILIFKTKIIGNFN